MHLNSDIKLTVKMLRSKKLIHKGREDEDTRYLIDPLNKTQYKHKGLPLDVFQP